MLSAAPPFPVRMPLERLGEEVFDGERFVRPGRWGLCFWAAWCGFSQEFLPEFASLEGDPTFRVAVIDLTDLGSPLWERFGIDVVPTVAAFDEGRLRWRKDGILGEGLGASDLRRLRDALTK